MTTATRPVSSTDSGVSGMAAEASFTPVTYDLNGKHVLVTGASAGIGAGLGRSASPQRGATVGICARRTDKLDEVLARVPGARARFAGVDDRPRRPRRRSTAFAARASDELGGIDVLVNNAGIPKRRTVAALDPATVEAVMAINYFSPVRLTLALLPGARRARRPHRVPLVGRGAPVAARRGGVRGVEGRDLGVGRVHEGRPARHRRSRSTSCIPGIIDTELFTLPDNDPSPMSIEALPVEALVGPVLDLIEQERFEVSVPDWFPDVYAGKYRDVEAFLDGTIAYVRTQEAEGTGVT